MQTTFGSPRRLQELQQALLCFSEKFLFHMGRIASILYHKHVSMIVSRFTTFTENFVIRGNENTRNFRLWDRPYRCVFCKKICNFLPQTYIAIPVFREVNKQVVFTRYHFCSRLQTSLMRRTGSVSMFWNTFINQSMLELL